MKGVILAGGLGTRMGDLTRITNKHLLPVYDRPMIYYPIQYMVDAGIKDIMVVVGGDHAGDFMRLLGRGDAFGCRLQYAYQHGNTGIAAALALTEDFVGGDNVCVLLGDNLFEHGIGRYIDEEDFMPTILIATAPDPTRFGVAIFDHLGIHHIEEKPRKTDSNYAVTGCYIYDRSVFDKIRTLKPSARNELEITDVNNAYLHEGGLTWDNTDGWWIDCGTPDSLLRASNLVKAKVVDDPVREQVKAMRAV